MVQQQLKQAKRYLTLHSDDGPDIAHTLAAQCENTGNRAFSIFHEGRFIDYAPVPSPLESLPKVVLVFNGQGGQWPGMGSVLIQTNSWFRDEITRFDDILDDLTPSRDWTITSM